MAAANLDLTVLKETISTGFRITFTVNQSENMTPNIFVLKADDNSYDRVASIFDINIDPVPETPTNGIPFYRATSFSKTFTFEERSLADEFDTDIPPMIDRLILEIRKTPFTGSELTNRPEA